MDPPVSKTTFLQSRPRTAYEFRRWFRLLEVAEAALGPSRVAAILAIGAARPSPMACEAPAPLPAPRSGATGGGRGRGRGRGEPSVPEWKKRENVIEEALRREMGRAKGARRRARERTIYPTGKKRVPAEGLTSTPPDMSDVPDAPSGAPDAKPSVASPWAREPVLFSDDDDDEDVSHRIIVAMSPESAARAMKGVAVPGSVKEAHLAGKAFRKRVLAKAREERRRIKASAPRYQATMPADPVSLFILNKAPCDGMEQRALFNRAARAACVTSEVTLREALQEAVKKATNSNVEYLDAAMVSVLRRWLNKKIKFGSIEDAFAMRRSQAMRRFDEKIASLIEVVRPEESTEERRKKKIELARYEKERWAVENDLIEQALEARQQKQRDREARRAARKKKAEEDEKKLLEVDRRLAVELESRNLDPAPPRRTALQKLLSNFSAVPRGKIGRVDLSFPPPPREKPIRQKDIDAARETDREACLALGLDPDEYFRESLTDRWKSDMKGLLRFLKKKRPKPKAKPKRRKKAFDRRMSAVEEKLAHLAPPDVHSDPRK